KLPARARTVKKLPEIPPKSAALRRTHTTSLGGPSAALQAARGNPTTLRRVSSVNTSRGRTIKPSGEARGEPLSAGTPKGEPRGEAFSPGTPKAEARSEAFSLGTIRSSR